MISRSVIDRYIYLTSPLLEQIRNVDDVDPLMIEAVAVADCVVLGYPRVPNTLLPLPPCFGSYHKHFCKCCNLRFFCLALLISRQLDYERRLKILEAVQSSDSLHDLVTKLVDILSF